MKVTAQQVVGIEVLPCFEDVYGVTSQPEGLDENTQFWTVYTRHADGFAFAFADYGTSEVALASAEELANLYNVEILKFPT